MIVPYDERSSISAVPTGRAINPYLSPSDDEIEERATASFDPPIFVQGIWTADDLNTAARSASTLMLVRWIGRLNFVVVTVLMIYVVGFFSLRSTWGLLLLLLRAS
jgi:hypothetical protein